VVGQTMNVPAANRSGHSFNIHDIGVHMHGWRWAAACAQHNTTAARCSVVGQVLMQHSSKEAEAGPACMCAAQLLLGQVGDRAGTHRGMVCWCLLMVAFEKSRAGAECGRLTRGEPKKRALQVDPLPGRWGLASGRCGGAYVELACGDACEEHAGSLLQHTYSWRAHAWLEIGSGMCTA
jgi:hypothetical protein